MENEQKPEQSSTIASKHEGETILSLPPTRANLIMSGLVELERICHNNSVAKGFWEKPRNFAEMTMLVVTELAEAVEAHRSGNNASDHIPDFSGMEEEIADAIIRLLDITGGLELNVASAVIAKLVYNQNREFRHGKSY